MSTKLISMTSFRAGHAGQREVARISARKHNRLVQQNAGDESYGFDDETPEHQEKRESLLSNIAAMIGYDSAKILEDIALETPPAIAKLKSLHVSPLTLDDAVTKADVIAMVSKVIPPAATTQILSMTRRQTIDSHRHDVLRAIIKYQQPRLAFWAAITDTVSPRMILEETAIPSSVATMLFESSLAGANLEPTFRTMILDAAHT